MVSGGSSSSYDQINLVCSKGYRVYLQMTCYIFKFVKSTLLQKLLADSMDSVRRNNCSFERYRTSNSARGRWMKMHSMYVDELTALYFLRLTHQTLTVFLGEILSKRYTNQSADIIAVVAGLDQVDAVFIGFATAIEGAIRNGRSGKATALDLWDYANVGIIVELRQKAIDVALALTCGAYQTSLVSYFTHPDLFPALMKVRNQYRYTARCLFLICMSYSVRSIDSAMSLYIGY